MLASFATDVMEALRADPAALSRFEGLPPSHKAEYLKWIDEAKRDETRRRRIAGMIEKLGENSGVPEAVGHGPERGDA
ncbi:MAG: YdeI/OmpD-associated family protein [Devosia sp.]